MKNFLCLGAGLATMPLLHEITIHPHLWNENRYRTTYQNTPHAEAEDILIRYSSPATTSDPSNLAPVQNDVEPQWYPAFQTLPQLRPLILSVMGAAGAYNLGRVLITKLVPGARILRHQDVEGDYVNRAGWQRYHLVLQGKPGSIFRCGVQEAVCMQTGEVWWFNAREEHEVVNNSECDRVHLIMDCRTFPS